MKKFIIISALALGLPAVAYAEDATAPKKECCCKKGEDGKMACCKDKDKKPGEHDHDMKGMGH